MRKPYVRTNEIRLKNSLALKGRKMSDAQKEKLKQAWIIRKQKGLGTAWNKGLRGVQVGYWKGKKRPPPSLATREKMRIAITGKTHSCPSLIGNQHRKGLAPWNKGTKGKQVAWNKGLLGCGSTVPHTEEWNRKISIALSGKNNGSWCGGIAKDPYTFGFNAKLRAKIKNRDGDLCQICSEHKKKMDVHHIDYDKANHAEKNLITLCCSCHIKTNARAKRDFYIKLLSEKVQRL